MVDTTSNIRPTDSASTGRSASPALDDVGYRILAALRENGRISMAALAERVGVSRANAYSRVEALMGSGVITGFSASVDPAKVGLSIGAHVFVTVHPQSWPAFRERVLELPEVEYCAVTTGEHDAMLMIRATDVGGVHDFSTAVIAQLPEVRTVVSVVILDEVVRRTFILPTDIPQREPAGTMGMTRWTPAPGAREPLPPR
ncbi:Lrp/AsnC family transcriptional regulator [Microbacterium sp. A82]|uniref:Lrp/AsnC family transcriptional regulator n=1 Tax=Microbacterium sp. A82 TaxID=3450452 RepID=UPI003F2D2644